MIIRITIFFLDKPVVNTGNKVMFQLPTNLFIFFSTDKHHSDRINVLRTNRSHTTVRRKDNRGTFYSSIHINLPTLLDTSKILALKEKLIPVQ